MSYTDLSMCCIIKLPSKRRKQNMRTFDYNKVRDPEYFRDGRLDAHSDHTYYAT